MPSSPNATPLNLPAIDDAAAVIARRFIRELPSPRDESSLDRSPSGVVHHAMERALSQLALLDCWGPANRMAGNRFWQIAGPLLRLGRLQLHAREKPFGYAGDFQMLQWICEDQRAGTGLAWEFDDFFQQQPAPIAVRNRARIVADAIAHHARICPKRTVRVVSVGSGPAFELQRLGRDDPSVASRLEVVLFDLDPRGLEFARQRLLPWFPASSVITHQVNLKRLATRADSLALLKNADFIYCSGFLDYLDQTSAVALIRLLWKSLTRSGRLIVFAFSKDNPTRTYMEWIGQWYLVYRCRDDMAQLGAEADLDPHGLRIGAEGANVNWFLDATAPV